MSKLDPDALLTRKKVAEALTEAGFPVSPTTLQTKVTRGGGPIFRLFGRVPLYRWGDALDWAQSRLSAPMTSSAARDNLPLERDNLPPQAAA